MTKLRHFDDLGTVRFVTFSCYYRLPSLDQPGAKEILIEEIDRARVKHRFQILAYVLMPEHVHLVLFPPEGMKLGLVIGEIKSRSAKRFFNSNVVPHNSTVDSPDQKGLEVPHSSTVDSPDQKGLEVPHSSTVGKSTSPNIRRVFWQRRCYDHNCRTPETVWEKINYCHNNPVKRGLVDDPSEWRWSSYNWFQGALEVPLLMDRLEQ